ncbi:MAG TPA: hypothetical protein VGK74_22400 [Symbiobacteriaceae bacterium]
MDGFILKRVGVLGRVYRRGGHFLEPDLAAAIAETRALLELWPAVQVWFMGRQVVELYAGCDERAWEILALRVGRIEAQTKRSKKRKPPRRTPL